MKILKLTLRKKWFDMILSGEKKCEYREIKTHWYSRLLIFDIAGNTKTPSEYKDFDAIEFKNGYSKNAPTILIECLGIDTGEAIPEWSDNWQGDVFRIKLGSIIKTENLCDNQ